MNGHAAIRGAVKAPKIGPAGPPHNPEAAPSAMPCHPPGTVPARPDVALIPQMTSAMSALASADCQTRLARIV
jgi:hypothetical protein